jgi:DNA-binding NarL/FixJ family response regulator
MPQLLRDIVTHAVESEDDMDIVGQLADAEPLDSVVGDTAADVVLLESREAGCMPALPSLLYRYPRLTAVAISPDARWAYLCELRPKETPVEGASPQELVTAIRDAVRSKNG